MIAVEVTFSPTLTKAERIVLNLPNKIAGLREFMINEVAPATNAMLLKHWNSKGAAFGRGAGKWAPLAPETIARKARKGTLSKGILRDTDHLFRTLFRARRADSRLKAIKDGLRLSLNTGVPYAIFHQFGTVNMPARQVIPDPLPVTFQRTIRKLFREYLKRD